MRKSLFLLGTVALGVAILSGCAKKVNKNTEAPALIEPVVSNEAYYTVSRGDVGVPEWHVANVEPEGHAQFYPAAVSIDEIVVKVGDQVKAGDVIAYADVSVAEAAIASYNEELEAENQQYEIDTSAVDLEILELKSQIDETTMTELEIAQINVHITEIEENKAYDAILHSRVVESIEARIAEQQKIVDDRVLYASCDGQVVFIKELQESRIAGVSEVIAMIADTNSRYLQIPYYTMEEYWKSTEYESMTVLYGGVEYPIDIIPYSEEEVLYANVYKMSLPARFTFEKIGEVQLGENYMIYMTKKRATDVICIDNICIKHDGLAYVYVCDEEGNRERRNIEIGLTDTYKSEIISGLSEGEKLLIESDSLFPSDEDYLDVVASDFQLPNKFTQYVPADTVTKNVVSKYEGTITLAEGLTKGKIVEEGELLYTIDTGIGKGAILRAEYDIQDKESEKETTLKELDNQIKELNSMEESSYKYLLIDQMKSQRTIVEISYDKQIEELNKAYDKLMENNDGNGVISVYAEISGEVAHLYVKSDQKVPEGEEILSITNKSGSLIKVFAYNADINELYFFPFDMADFGEQVTIELAGDKFTGTCVGVGPTDDVLVEQKNNHVYFPNYLETDALKYFYLKMDEGQDFDVNKSGKAVFEYMKLRDVCVIPKNFIFEEMDNRRNKYNYVWKKDGENIIKQYVTVSEDSLATTDSIVVIYGISSGDVLYK